MPLAIHLEDHVMTTKIGRPVEFEASKREKFCLLVGVGVTRRHAAASLGVAPSTVTRQMQADPLFAEAVRDAEIECEIDLMKRVRLQSERSWRACVWLLERMHPERYARGKQSPATPSWDEMFDRFVALIDTEVADEGLRERLVGRLDDMAMEELAAQEMEDAPKLTHAGRLAESTSTMPAARQDNGMAIATAPAAAPVVTKLADKVAQNGEEKGDKAGSRRSANRLPACGILSADRIETLLDRGHAAGGRNGAALDFCNTSPDVHERRAMKKVCS
jgi:hypothetical protein